MVLHSSILRRRSNMFIKLLPRLLDSRCLMWCDEANTVIQKTLGDGMDFYVHGGMGEGLERGKDSTDIRFSIVLPRCPTTSRDQSKLSIFSHDWSMLRVIINKTGLPKAQERRLYLTWTGDPKRLIQLESCANYSIILLKKLNI